MTKLHLPQNTETQGPFESGLNRPLKDSKERKNEGKIPFFFPHKQSQSIKSQMETTVEREYFDSGESGAKGDRAAVGWPGNR